MNGTYLVWPMLTAYLKISGEYTLITTPTNPVEITLTHTRIEIRRNVRSSGNGY